MELAAVAICLFGSNVGQVIDLYEQPEYRTKNTTRGFFSISQPCTVDILKTLDYNRFAYNTTYTPALSIHEIRYLLNEKLLWLWIKKLY